MLTKSIKHKLKQFKYFIFKKKTKKKLIKRHINFQICKFPVMVYLFLLKRNPEKKNRKKIINYALSTQPK